MDYTFKSVGSFVRDASKEFVILGDFAGAAAEVGQRVSIDLGHFLVNALVEEAEIPGAQGRSIVLVLNFDDDEELELIADYGFQGTTLALTTKDWAIQQ